MVSVTQLKFIEAPMNLPVGDRIMLLNIVLRDMQAGGARIFSTRMVGNGWEVEYMGEPEVAADAPHE